MKTKFQTHFIIFLVALILTPIIFVQVDASDSNNNNYGYIIGVNPNQNYSTQAEISKLVNELLNEKVTVYWMNKDFSVSSQEIDQENNAQSHSFNRGSFIVPISDDSTINAKASLLTYKYSICKKVKAYKIMNSVSDIDAYTLIMPKIAHYDGEGVSLAYSRILKKGGFLNQNYLKTEDVINDLDNENYNIFIWGGQAGNHTTVLTDMLDPPGLIARNKIRNFVRSGGGYIGSCYGGWRAASGYRRPIGYPLDVGYNSFLNFLPIQLNLINLPVYRALPGGGDITVKITNPNHPIAFGLPELIENHVYYAGPMFIDNIVNGRNSETLAVIEEAEREDWMWDFMMNLNVWWNSKTISNETKMNMANKWIDNSIGKSLWVTAKFGKGKVVAFGGHPEFTNIDDNSMAYNSPPRVVYNTIFYMASIGPQSVDLEKSYLHSKLLDADTGGPYVGLEDKSIELKGKVDGGTPPYNWYWESEVPYWYYYREEIDNTRETQNATFFYEESGVYDVFLTVTDSNGNFGFDKTSIEIVSRYEELRVKLKFRDWAYENENITFTSSVINGMPPFTYEWSFGDGFSSTEKEPIHSYNEPGTYLVSLEVKDNFDGCEKITRHIEITKQENIFSDPGSVSIVISAIMIVVIILILVFALVIYLKRKNQT